MSQQALIEQIRQALLLAREALENTDTNFLTDQFE